MRLLRPFEARTTTQAIAARASLSASRFCPGGIRRISTASNLEAVSAATFFAGVAAESDRTGSASAFGSTHRRSPRKGR